MNDDPAEKLTLCERESDGLTNMKLGEHGDHPMRDGDELTTNKAIAVVNLDEPLTQDGLVGADIDDLPDIVDLFLNDEGDDEGQDGSGDVR